VFAITSISSIFAYVWLFIVLGVWTKDQVTMVEAVLTFGFFFVLIILAYAADKINERKKDKLKTAEQKKAEQKKQI